MSGGLELVVTAGKAVSCLMCACVHTSSFNKTVGKHHRCSRVCCIQIFNRNIYLIVILNASREDWTKRILLSVLCLEDVSLGYYLVICCLSALSLSCFSSFPHTVCFVSVSCWQADLYSLRYLFWTLVLPCMCSWQWIHWLMRGRNHHHS